jgi:hypothetical protein
VELRWLARLLYCSLPILLSPHKQMLWRGGRMSCGALVGIRVCGWVGWVMREGVGNRSSQSVGGRTPLSDGWMDEALCLIEMMLRDVAEDRGGNELGAVASLLQRTANCRSADFFRDAFEGMNARSLAA